MSRRDASIYVGRLSKNLRTKDVEEMFEPYGRLLRCDIKYGSEMAYAFIDFEAREDAEDCVKFENGREVDGQNIIVEWAKGEKDRRMGRRSDSSSQNFDECFRCRRRGHWARDCPEMRLGRRGGGGGGGGGGRWRSPSPRRRSRSRSRDRRRRSRSRSRDRRRRSRSNDKRRSRSRSGDRKRSRSRSRRSRSASNDKKTSRRSRSRSLDNKKRSVSKSRSRSKSPRRSRSGSKSKSRSRSPSQKPENHLEQEANGKSPQDNTHHDDDGDDHREDYGDQDGNRRSRSTSKD